MITRSCHVDTKCFPFLGWENSFPSGPLETAWQLFRIDDTVRTQETTFHHVNTISNVILNTPIKNLQKLTLSIIISMFSDSFISVIFLFDMTSFLCLANLKIWNWENISLFQSLWLSPTRREQFAKNENSFESHVYCSRIEEGHFGVGEPVAKPIETHASNGELSEITYILYKIMRLFRELNQL